MAADIQGRDPKSLWQDQQQETDPVTLEHVHDLARKMDLKARFTPAAMALGLIITGFIFGVVWIGVHDALRRAVVILSVVGVLGVYAIIYRMELPSRDPAEPASADLRRRLQRKLSYRQGGWVLALLPLLPAMLLAGYRVLSSGPSHLLAKTAPFLLVGAALIFLGVRNWLRAGQTRAELQELDELLKR